MLQVSQPIQKVPPGIHTIPSGAGPEAGVVLTCGAAGGADWAGGAGDGRHAAVSSTRTMRQRYRIVEKGVKRESDPSLTSVSSRDP